MKNKKQKGYFITVEGIEGTGKSTAIQFIKELLQQQKIPFVLTREPGGTAIAEAIRHVLLAHYDEQMCADTELLLMFAGRAQHIQEVIRPALAAGKWVLSDRFTDATYAYQGGGRKVANCRIAALEDWVQGELQPDLVFLLDAPIEIGFRRIEARGAKDRIEKEQIQFFQHVRQAYLERAKTVPEKYKIIDATQPLPQVHNAIKATLQEKFIG